MHFSSSSSTVIFSLAGLFLQVLVSRELAVSVRSRSLFLRCSDCWSTVTGPFFSGRSRVWTWAWGCGWRLTGPQMTVPWGELASDWLSELEVESSLKEVPLSPSPSPLWFLQQQSQGGEDQRDEPPADRGEGDVGRRERQRETEPVFHYTRDFLSYIYLSCPSRTYTEGVREVEQLVRKKIRMMT